MSKVIHLKKGLDILLEGEASSTITELPLADGYAIKPDDFKGFTPKLLVKQGDVVVAGDPLLFDKYRPEVVVSSPVSGTVSAINRGEKRKILEVVVTPSETISHKEFSIPKNLTKEQAISLMLESGLWSFIIQRPYGIIANPGDCPKAIFVSGFDSSPLAPDMEFVLKNEQENINKAVEVLSGIAKIYLGVKDGSQANPMAETKGAEVNFFKGPHPAGNVGVQIHHISPVSKGETVWTIDVQNLAIIGRFFATGKVDMRKTIALVGSEVAQPQYYSIVNCANLKSITHGRIKEQKEGDKVRIISGNVLTGVKTEECSYIGFYSNQITVIPEGDKYEFVGWIAPRLNKFSVSRSYFSWLSPKKRYSLDTNLNGGERALVMTALYDNYLPMDIYSVYLLKAAIAGDVDKMESLGMYEIIEEDMALCEFVDPSKTEWQEIVRGGIDLMIKELS